MGASLEKVPKLRRICNKGQEGVGGARDGGESGLRVVLRVSEENYI